MKELLNGPAGLFLALASMVIALGAVLATCMRVEYGHREEMARLGYEQTTIPGRAGVVWRKAD